MLFIFAWIYFVRGIFRQFFSLKFYHNYYNKMFIKNICCCFCLLLFLLLLSFFLFCWYCPYSNFGLHICTRNAKKLFLWLIVIIIKASFVLTFFTLRLRKHACSWNQLWYFCLWKYNNCTNNQWEDIKVVKRICLLTNQW